VPLSGRKSRIIDRPSLLAGEGGAPSTRREKGTAAKRRLAPPTLLPTLSRKEGGLR